MEEVQLFCVNHPRAGTLVRCSSCGSAICVRCMVETPVGMKCPACARVRLRPEEGRRRYLAGAAGLLTAASIAGVMFAVRGSFFGLLMAMLLGLVTGSVVRKVGGAARPGMASVGAIATGCGLALGLLAVKVPFPALLSPGFLLPSAFAAAVAALTAGR